MKKRLIAVTTILILTLLLASTVIAYRPSFRGTASIGSNSERVVARWECNLVYTKLWFGWRDVWQWERTSGTIGRATQLGTLNRRSSDCTANQEFVCKTSIADTRSLDSLYCYSSRWWTDYSHQNYYCECTEPIAQTRAPAARAAFCTDTDGGWNLNAKGTCSCTDGFVGTDTCSNTNQTGILEYGMVDGYCFGSDMDCAESGKVCQDGKCILPQQQQPNCFDSDGGKNYPVRGTITFHGQQGATDSCLNSNYLNESFCGPFDTPEYEYVNCRCNNGAC